MSSGYKHLYSCVTFILFMVVVNFYKNKIHQAREREASVRAKMRQGAPKPSLQLLRRRITLDEEAAIMQRRLEDPDDALEELYPDSYYFSEVEIPNPFLERMKEYPGQCRDMEAFYFSKDRETELYPPTNQLQPLNVVAKQSTRVRHGPPINPPGSSKPSNSNSMYVFLSVLIILLIAAAVDIAKHIRAIPRRQDHIRRLSLQNYQALIREKQKQFRMMKQHCSQPSMSIHQQQSIDGDQLQVVHRAKEDTLFEAAKPAMILPAPLLRRQSVPVGLMTVRPTVASFGAAKNSHLFRRPSVDSFGLAERAGGPELDGGVFPNGSPTEVRRRVRMLHRH